MKKRSAGSVSPPQARVPAPAAPVEKEHKCADPSGKWREDPGYFDKLNGCVEIPTDNSPYAIILHRHAGKQSLQTTHRTQFNAARFTL